MKIEKLHDWQLGVEEAIELQKKLAAQVSRSGQITSPRFIAGVDIAAGDPEGVAMGAVVVLSYPELELVETKVATGKLAFPYVPGLLAFREMPLILAACEKLSHTPDFVIVDGQGIAHPRRMGLASHLGLFLKIPTIGCAKSRLYGSHNSPGSAVGNYELLVDMDSGEIIGAALRTKSGANPVFVSIGHKVDLQTAIRWVLNLCRSNRLPEPIRLAHQAAGGNLKQDEEKSGSGFQQKLFE